MAMTQDDTLQTRETPLQEDASLRQQSAALNASHAIHSHPPSVLNSQWFKELQKQYQVVTDSFRDAVYIVDTQGEIVFCNVALSVITGHAVEELLGRPSTDLYPPTIRPLFLERRAQLFSGHPVSPLLEAMICKKDGSLLPVELSVTSLLHEGQLTGRIVILRDLTERKQAEEKFRALLEFAPDAMVIVNTDGAITLVNTQAERLFGYSRHELLGQCIDILVPKRFRPIHLVHRRQYVAAPGLRLMGSGRDLYGRHKNGREIPIEVSLSPLQTVDGLLILSAIRDLTERQRIQEALQIAYDEMEQHVAERTAALQQANAQLQAEVIQRQQARELLMHTNDELRRSNQELEQFAYATSHDLQEPLRSVANFTERFAAHYAGQLDPKAKKYMGYIVDGVTRMQGLIKDLLTYSRVAREAPQESTDTEAVFKTVLANLEATLRECQGVVTHDPLPIVQANPLQMGQLLQNLIGNALKFRGATPPRVHIHVTQTPQAWQFAVQDNGIGIDPKYAKRIFGIFQRLHTRTEYSGTGIGLAICQKIVERQGGRIWVESHPGQGATFYFTIPCGNTDMAREAV
jgi:PAS domain S-box-containing protein